MTTGKKAAIFIIVVVVIGGFIAFGLYNVQRQQADSGIPRNAIPVQLEYAHRETIVSKVSAKGVVELVDKETLYPRSQAFIQTIYVKPGDTVKSGDLLLTYDEKALESYQDQLADAKLMLRSAELALSSLKLPPSETELLQAETQMKQAQKAIGDIEVQIRQIDLNMTQITVAILSAEQKYGDVRALYEQGAVTKLEVDNAYDGIKNLRNQLETAQAQKEAALLGIPMAENNVILAQSQYEALTNRLDEPKARIQIQTQEIAVEQARLRVEQIEKNIDAFEAAEYAVVSGTVLALYVSEGESSVSGRPLMDIADTSNQNLVISIYVPEADAKDIQLGQEVEIKGAALGNQVYKGQVSRIYPLAEKKQIGNTAETVLTIEIAAGDDVALRAGYTIETAIVTKITEDALVIPLMSTLSDTDGTHYVYVMGEDYSVEKRIITLGEYAGIYVEAGNISEHDRLIINPSNQIKEGVFVKPIAG